MTRGARVGAKKDARASAAPLLIGVDWGGTKIEGVAMERDGRELLRLREATPRHDYDACIRVIGRIIDGLEAEAGRKGQVGIGIPGSLEPQSRLGKGASSTWLLGKPVERDLHEALQRPLRVENDADCFAASEAIDGAGVGHNVVFAVILGSGAGAGIAVGAKAHHGPNNSGGEWGHNPLPLPDVTEIGARPCYCGRHGCMETWVSGRAFEAEYAKHKGEERKAAEIVGLMRAGDHLASRLWERYVDRVARGLAVVVNALDPDVLVMGGGMSNVDELYDDLPNALAKRIFSTVFHTPIVRAKHGDSSGVRGAAWLWK